VKVWRVGTRRMAVLLIHGGAGGDGPWGGPTELDPQRLASIRSVLEEMGGRLQSGDLDALEAVTRAVEMLEDEPLFNAGRGSVLAADGGVTMDASIMRGSDGAAGSVIDVRRIRHPIRAARELLEGGWPVMLNGDAADSFAIGHGVEEVTQDWLRTALRTAQLRKWRAGRGRPGSTDEDDGAMLDHDAGESRQHGEGDEAGGTADDRTGADDDLTDRVSIEFSDEGFEEPEAFGTVGAVALDESGGLAAATSTGGMTGKPAGRIGDAPIIGAGTWADPRAAVSCTGVGEAFIRTVAAHRMAVLFELTGDGLDACATRVLDEVRPLGGRGGLIAVTADGRWTLPFQTTLMYRGVWATGEMSMGIGPDMQHG